MIASFGLSTISGCLMRCVLRPRPHFRYFAPNGTVYPRPFAFHVPTFLLMSALVLAPLFPFSSLFSYCVLLEEFLF